MHRRNTWLIVTAPRGPQPNRAVRLVGDRDFPTAVLRRLRPNRSGEIALASGQVVS